MTLKGVLIVTLAIVAVMAFGVFVTIQTGSSFLGALAIVPVIVVYALFAKESHDRKVKGEPPMVQIRRRDASES